MTKEANELPSEAIAALWQGNKIEAIKIVRQATNIGLKDAKDKVDEYVRNEPALRHKLATTQAESTRHLLRWVMILAAIAVAAYYFILRR